MEIPKALADAFTEYKRKQDAVRPGPVPLEVLALLAVIYGKGGEGNKKEK